MKRFILLSFIALYSVSVYGQQHMQYVTSSMGITIESKNILKREIATPDKFQQSVSAGWWVNSSWYTPSYSAVRLSYAAGIRFNHFVYLGLSAGLDIATMNADKPYVTDDMNNSYGDYAKYYVGKPQYGSTVDNWDYVNYELPMQRVAVPLYVNIKAYCSTTKVVPYFSGSVGARFSIPKRLKVYDCNASHTYYESHIIGNYIDYYDYGAVTPFFDVAFGVDVKLSNAGSFSFQVGYNTHVFRTLYCYSNDYYFGSKFCHGLSLTLGYTF